jgi:probable HAF family extracellular repeat protein
MSPEIVRRLSLLAGLILPLSGCADRTTAPPPKSAPTQAELARNVGALEPVDLGTLGGPSTSRSSQALAVNPAGAVVGWSTVPNPFLGTGPGAVLWLNGQIIDLGALGGHLSTAYAINPQGVIAGAAGLSQDFFLHAFIWRDGKMSDLGTLRGPDASSLAYGIDPSGRVVGESDTPSHNRHAVLWDDGEIVDLGTLGGATSAAYAISPSGMIVGSAATAVGDMHAFVWRNAVMRDLGTLGGASSAALAVDAAGDVVGWSTNASGAKHAVLWSKGSAAITDLGTMGRPESVATGINAAGQIVGYFTGAPSSGAFIWQGGVMTELPGDVITPGQPQGGGSPHAFAISPTGDVVGDARTFLQTHAVIWTRR